MSRSESSFVFDEDVVHRQPGSHITKHRSIAVDETWRIDSAWITPVEDIVVEFQFESAADGVFVTFSADLPMQAQCVRDLEELDWLQPVSGSAFFEYEQTETDSDEDAEEDVFAIIDGKMDLEPAFRDAALLALPLNPVCRADCLGLCPECGLNRNTDPDHHHERQDPRWQALQDFVEKTETSVDVPPGNKGD